METQVPDDDPIRYCTSCKTYGINLMTGECRNCGAVNRGGRTISLEEQELLKEAANASPKDIEIRYCSTCNTMFETVQGYRRHHITGNCGGIRS